MKKLVAASLMALVLTTPSVTRTQILVEDVQLNCLKGIYWRMSSREAVLLLQKKGYEAEEQKENLVSTVELFGLSTILKLHFDRSTKELDLISTQVEKPTQTARDSVLNHFTRTLGPPIGRENKKQKIAIVELDVERLKWKTRTSMVVVTIMKSGADFVNVGFVLFPSTIQN